MEPNVVDRQVGTHEMEGDQVEHLISICHEFYPGNNSTNHLRHPSSVVGFYS